MEKYLVRASATSNEIHNGQASAKRVRTDVEISDSDIVADPGLRQPIDSYSVNIRDHVRRRYLAKGPCQPMEHKFPQTNYSGGKRAFLPYWFKRFPWLEYSVSKNKAFCLWCYLFPDDKKKNGGTSFTLVGYSNWKDVVSNFSGHEGGHNSQHSGAKVRVVKYKNQRENIDVILSSQSADLNDQYRARLTTVLSATRFLLGEGLSFRGHDESVESMPRGHFLELISWLCDRDKEVAKVMQSNAPKNNQMTSSTIQRDMIEACGKETRKVILNEIGNKVFSLLLDEARDSSIKEQMAVGLRYVNDHGEVIKRFIGVVHVSETSSQELKNVVDDFFGKNGLSLSRLRGQGYDGASNMRGELNGLQTLILKENKHAHFIHCFAHQLQLVIVSSAEENEDVCQFFDYVSMIVNLVGGSCKRQDSLRQSHHAEIVKRIENGEVLTGKGKNQDISLARSGTTRWGSHYKTLLRLFDMWSSVEKVLLAINKDGDTRKSRGTTKGLLDKMGSFEFVFYGKLMLLVLGAANPLSKILQYKNQNIGAAVHAIEGLKIQIQTYRESGWENLLNEVIEFCVKQDIEVPILEEIIPSRTRKLVDGAPKTYLHHFRIEIFTTVLDEVAKELHNRFNETNTNLLKSMVCLNPSKSFAHFDHAQIMQLASLYSEDFSSSELAELHHELESYITTMRHDPEFSKLDDIGALAKKW